MNKSDVITRFCMLASDVGDRVFQNKLAADCFCETKEGEASIDPKVMLFIKDAVDAATAVVVEKRKAERETRNLCQRLIDTGITPDMAAAVMKELTKS